MALARATSMSSRRANLHTQAVKTPYQSLLASWRPEVSETALMKGDEGGGGGWKLALCLQMAAGAS